MMEQPLCSCRRVGVVALEFPPVRGGIGTYVSDVVSFLARNRRVDVVLTLAGAATPDTKSYGPGVTFHDARGLPPRERAELIVRLAHRDGIHTWLFGQYDAAPPELMRRLCGHGISPSLFAYGTDVALKRGPRGRIRMHLQLLAMRRVIAISHATRRVVRTRFPGARTALVFPGVRVPETTARRGPGRGIVSVGRLVRRKGFDVLLDAFATLCRETPDLRLTIIGDGPERDALHRQAARLGVQGHVRFLHDRGNDETRREMSEHRVFCQLPRELPDGDVEGFGIVFLEAAAEGIPVVAGKSGGVPDAVSDGRNGFLVPPARVDIVAERLRLLLSDDALCRRMSEASVAWAGRFDWRTRDPASEFAFLEGAASP